MESSSTTLVICEKAIHFLEEFWNDFNDEVGLGHMSSTIYDTAWVAMVKKSTEAEQEWMFPICFQYIIAQQKKGGGWTSNGSVVDDILNSAAGLLCLRKHSMSPLQLLGEHPPDLEYRIVSAEASLRAQLLEWNVDQTDQVGFEILVPAMLTMLEEDLAAFDFPERRQLYDIRDRKLQYIPIELFYETSDIVGTAIHSLEGFVEKLDFDRLRHRLNLGSMMASPSSTAAYLIYSKTWDNEAEEYLHRVVNRIGKHRHGGVPSAFPSTYFEAIWIVATLLKADAIVLTRQSPAMTTFIRIIQQAFDVGGGLVGFAPGISADADDTAMAITCFNKLGIYVNPHPFVEAFQCGTYFKTYGRERNISLSANCNALMALSTSPDTTLYRSQICSLVRFICDWWRRSNKPCSDKWNLSCYYPMMLMTQSLCQVLQSWVTEFQQLSSESELIQDIIVTLFQILVRILRNQENNGSWGHNNSCEESTYGLIALKTLKDFPCAQSIRGSIDLAILKGMIFLSTFDDEVPPVKHLWIEKITYSSIPMTRAYLYAALYTTPYTQWQVNDQLNDVFRIPIEKVKKFGKFFAQLPMFQDVPSWFLPATLIEGYLIQPRVKSYTPNIFTRRNMTKARYLEYIPFTWVAANGLKMSFISPEFIYQMNVISILNYQVDEFMEGVVAKYFEHRLSEVKTLIEDIFDRLSESHPKPLSNGHHSPESLINTVNGKASSATKRHILESRFDSSLLHRGIDVATSAAPAPVESNQEVTLHEIRETIGTFATYIVSHEGIKYASTIDKADLRRELRTFLHAHIVQIEHSRSRNNIASSKVLNGETDQYGNRENSKSEPAKSQQDLSFANWVQTTAAQHTSCPYSFVFAGCLLATSETRSLFPHPLVSYVAKAACSHLATLCRMYNDYGSLKRDREEGNMNCVDFAEFGTTGDLTMTQQVDIDRKACTALMELADYERACLNDAVRRLENSSSVGELAKRFLTMFVHVTDTYGQIYVLKDIASRVT